MSFPNDRTYNFDINLLLSDNAAAYTASGFLTVGGANAIVDVGGNQGTSPVQQARIDAMLILDVTAITVSGTQTYQFDILLSNDPAFGAGNVVMGPGIQLGVGASLRGANAQSSVTGRYEVGFSTQIAGTIYEYVMVFLTAANSPSIGVTAFVAVLPEP